YDNFARFISVFESVGKRIDQAKESYEESHKKLTTGRGNLLTRADKLKKLGAKTSKTLSAELVEKAGSELPQLGNPDGGKVATEKD
ncbi:MAG: DNA recombination protein RmuC, partial [Pseudomonadota bacterium]|nr:DNA recombination protein RmuC [Pseudomonadota bacterium]